MGLTLKPITLLHLSRQTVASGSLINSHFSSSIPLGYAGYFYPEKKKKSKLLPTVFYCPLISIFLGSATDN